MRYLFGVLLTLSASTQAAVLRVGSGCTHSTLQSALAAAQFGDELRLRTQTYVENVTVDTQVTIRGGYASCSATTPNAFDRATIQSASSGAPVMFASSPGATIELQRLNLSGANNPGGDGGGLRINFGTRVEVDLVSMTGNSAGTGGGIFIAGGNATLASNGGLSLTVSNNSADIGGGIYASSGAVIDLLTSPLATVNIDDNLSTGSGAALFFSASTISLANVSFDNNSAGFNGGAIANNIATGPASLEIADSSFSNNVAVNQGGAIRLQQGSTGTVQLTLTDTAFSSNSVTDAQGFGGAAMISDNVTIDMARVSFSNNSAARGGGLALGGAQLTLTGASFSDNIASIDGGALYAGANSQWELLHAVAAPVLFSGNSASGRGGAIYDVSGQPNQIAPGDIAGSSVMFSSNQANLGGAIYLSSGGIIGLSLPTQFDGNVALADGGAIYVTGSNSFLFSDGIGSPTDRLEFSGNQAAASGGALFLANGASGRLDWVSIGVNGAGNTAATGGGVYFEGNGDLQMRNSAVIDNQAGAGAGVFLGPGADALIGAVHGPADQVPLPGQPRNCDLVDLAANQYCSVMRNNQTSGGSGVGGALQATFTTAVTVSKTHLVGNLATSGAALAVMNGAEVLVENSLIEGHSEAVFVDQNATLDLYQTTLTNNGNNTLQLASDPSTMVLLRNSILWGNTQGLIGGALAMLGGDCNITQSAQFTGLMVDPEFTSDSRGDYRLGATSAALNACMGGAALDMDGRQRPAAGSYDMGAFEMTLDLPDSIFDSSFESP